MQRTAKMIAKSTSKNDIIMLASGCRRCGHCCRFRGCYLLPSEIRRLSGKFWLSEKKFIEKYCDEVERFNKKVLRFKSKKIQGKPYGPCIFLKNNECRIHKVKPLYCRIGNCNEYGFELSQWYVLNHFVNANDPESIRQWSIYLKSNKNRTIPGGKLSELVPDKNRLRKILNFEILR